MRHMTNGRNNLYSISGHALAQYMERARCQDWAEAERKLREKLDTAKEVDPPFPSKGRKYLKSGTWILVISRKTLVTCYFLQAWQKKRGMWSQSSRPT